MGMVSIAQPDMSEIEDYKPNPYGYGTCICLTDEQVELLGLDKNPPAAGSTVTIQAIAKVVRVISKYDPIEEAAEGEDPESIDVALELQITDMEVNQGGGQSSTNAASMLYGGNND
jgi:hypothetical protein